MNMLPANINVASARLPETYERAKQALADCASIDECQKWANKAEVLASYAKQADDDSLRKFADRIQAWAVRRCGELLLLIEPAKNQHDANRRAGAAYVGALTCSGSSRTDAAKAAGLSTHKKVTALRVGKVPETVFEDAVESESPPTVTKLAEMGINARPKPEGFNQATHLLGTVRRFAEFCSGNDPVRIAHGVMLSEIRELKEQVAVIDGWLDRFVVNLGA